MSSLYQVLKQNVSRRSQMFRMFLTIFKDVTTFVFNGAFVHVTLDVTLRPESLAAVRAAVNK